MKGTPSASVSFPLNSSWDLDLRADDGEFFGCSGDGYKASPKRPIRNPGILVQPANREGVWQDGKCKLRVGHILFLITARHTYEILKEIINSLIIVKTLFYKIPPNLPLPKGGIIPLFEKEGRGEIF
jgi:hypothetical protein